MEHDHNSIKWAIGLLASLWIAVTGWILARVNKSNSKSSETRITLAERHYTKLEVQQLVDREVGPINKKLEEIHKLLIDHLVKRP